MSTAIYKQLLKQIAEYAEIVKRPVPRLIAVSKFEPLEALQVLYDAGCRDFAESRVQEALVKKAALPDDICWHLIGHLQSNKVNKAVGSFSLIHSVHSYELLCQIAEKKVNQPVLLQVNTSGEESKQGLSAPEWERYDFPKGVQIRGLMTMAPHTGDEGVIRACFRELKKTADKWGLEELSMGMSSDWKIALEEGATLLRVGRSLFRSFENPENKTP